MTTRSEGPECPEDMEPPPRKPYRQRGPSLQGARVVRGTMPRLETAKTPDATLDGLLERHRRQSVDEIVGSRPVSGARAETETAIHAHVAQREAALREEVQLARWTVANARREHAETWHTLRAEVERLREALREIAPHHGAGPNWDVIARRARELRDEDAALASPCAVPPKPRQVPPHTVGGPASGYGP